jgi:hypothetical protein
MKKQARVSCLNVNLLAQVRCKGFAWPRRKSTVYLDLAGEIHSRNIRGEGAKYVLTMLEVFLSIT